jgi:hypothetical protein
MISATFLVRERKMGLKRKVATSTAIWVAGFVAKKVIRKVGGRK